MFLTINHKNEDTPYLSLYFGENKNLLYSQREFVATSIESVNDAGATHGKSLKWTNTGFIPASNYINWSYQTFSSAPFSVQQGDRFELRIRLSENTRKMYSDVIKGKIYLASADDFYSVPLTFVSNSYEKKYFRN